MKAGEKVCRETACPRYRITSQGCWGLVQLLEGRSTPDGLLREPHSSRSRRGYRANRRTCVRISRPVVSGPELRCPLAQVADCKSWRSSRYPRRLIRCTFQLTCLIPVYLLRQERDQCPRPHSARCGSRCRGLAPQPEKLLLLSPAQTQVHMLPLRPRFCDADGPSDRWPGQWRGWPSLHQLCPPRGQETAPHPTAGPLGLTPPFLWQLHSC